MRLIDADALKKRLIKRRDQIAEERRYGWEFEYNGLNGAVLLTGCEAVQHRIEPMPHWIPCSERLPYAEYGESDNVLATCGHRNVEDGSIRWIRTLYFNGSNWCYPTGETCLEKVYAWMPLPEPYEGQK